MTLEEIKLSDKVMLTPADISDVMRSDPQSIRKQAHENPAVLGFPVCVVGSRVKIPKAAFLNWVGGAK